MHHILQQQEDAFVPEDFSLEAYHSQEVPSAEGKHYHNIICNPPLPLEKWSAYLKYLHLNAGNLRSGL